MFTYRIALLQSLGINYESLSEHLVLRGKHYTRGPSFTKQQYLEATEYCLSHNLQGLSCILVDAATEFTVWLNRQHSNSVETSQIDDSPTVASPQQFPQTNPQTSPPPTPEVKSQLTYRGVKYNVKNTLPQPDLNSIQNEKSLAQLKSESKSRRIYRGVEMTP